VVGLGWHTNYKAEGFQWAEATGMVGLGQPAVNRSSRASAISADASTVVGFSEHPSFGYRRPVRWINGGEPDLFLGADMPGEVLAANSDGSVRAYTIKRYVLGVVNEARARWSWCNDHPAASHR
jgi:uncharacterized membrane protein